MFQKILKDHGKEIDVNARAYRLASSKMLASKSITEITAYRRLRAWKGIYHRDGTFYSLHKDGHYMIAHNNVLASLYIQVGWGVYNSYSLSVCFATIPYKTSSVCIPIIHHKLSTR